MSDNLPPRPYPRALNHIGMNVPDLDAAILWYRDVLGFQLIIPAFQITAHEGEPGERFVRLGGPNFGQVRLAYLTSGNGVGLELFEFAEPRTKPFADDWEYWRPGVWHISITDPDIEGLAARIAETGGRRRSDIVEAPPGSGFQLVFCQDPWGNPIELMTASYDRSIQSFVR